MGLPYTGARNVVQPIDLSRLKPQDREVAVAHFLSEASRWLADAMITGDPMAIKIIKAEAISVLQAARQLNLDREIVLDAQEMVRRTERALAQATIHWQALGKVNSVGHQGGGPRKAYKKRSGVLIEVTKPHHTDRISPREIFNNPSEWTDSRILASVSDAVFDQLITEGREDNNLSRSSLIRKITTPNIPSRRLAGEQRLNKIREYAQLSMTAHDIGVAMGHSEDFIKRLAKDHDIDLPAERILASMHGRKINSSQLAEATVNALETTANHLDLFDPANVADRSHLEEWATSVGNSIKIFQRFYKQLREMTYTK